MNTLANRGMNQPYNSIIAPSVADAVHARLRRERPEVVEEHPGPHRMAVARGKRAPHGEGADGGDLRVDDAIDAARGVDGCGHCRSRL